MLWLSITHDSGADFDHMAVFILSHPSHCNVCWAFGLAKWVCFALGHVYRTLYCATISEPGGTAIKHLMAETDTEAVTAWTPSSLEPRSSCSMTGQMFVLVFHLQCTCPALLLSCPSELWYRLRTERHEMSRTNMQRNYTHIRYALWNPVRPSEITTAGYHTAN